VVDQIMSSLATILLAVLMVLPAAADVRQTQPVPQAPQALRLMNDGEFTLFLRRLDIQASRWQLQLSDMKVGFLSPDQQESVELKRSYGLCLESLDITREEIRSLSEKQTLRHDFLLLVDLNDLERNLDQLTRDLMDVNGERIGMAPEALGYARQVLSTDAALASYLVEFQRHILAFAAVIDATVDETDKRSESPRTQDENPNPRDAEAIPNRF